MAEEKSTILTESGLKKLEEQLDYLISVRRNEVSEQIAIARGFGDLSENAEYDEAKNQKNIRKHHISIPELATIFENPFIAPTMDVPDVMHSVTEKRYHAYGWTTTGWYVKIWYCYKIGRAHV